MRVRNQMEKLSLIDIDHADNSSILYDNVIKTYELLFEVDSREAS